MHKLLKASLLAVAVSVSFNLVAANEPVSGTMKAFIVELKGEKETLREAGEVEPNQIVEYQLTYKNSSEEAVSGLKVTGPVPAGTKYISDTAQADVKFNLLVSVDGGKTFESEPVIRKTTKENGELVEMVISPDLYTHLLWQPRESLQAQGGKQFFSYRVKIK